MYCEGCKLGLVECSVRRKDFMGKQPAIKGGRDTAPSSPSVRCPTSQEGSVKVLSACPLPTPAVLNGLPPC